MVLYGFESTIPVSLDLMMNHGKAVVNATSKAFVVVDVPFGYYQKDKEHAFDSCAKLLKETGAQAVKLEGGVEMAETIEYLTNKMQGKTANEVKSLVKDAEAIEKAGVFAFVLECVSEKAASAVTKKAKTAVIGIGAGSKCDGQILVTEDMLGITEFAPSFVKNYGGLRDMMFALKNSPINKHGLSFNRIKHWHYCIRTKRRDCRN